MIAQGLVLGAGALTTWLVASAIGPSIFHDHLARAGDDHSQTEARHLEEAFGSALLLSLTMALLASVAAALAVSWYFSRRIQRSIASVTDAAAGIAAGHYDVRVPMPGLGTEFDTLAEGYNSLAGRLDSVEMTRRRMLTDLAHEMRTPLATVDAHLEAVEDGVRELDENTLEVIRLSTTRLRRLAEDISAVSRAEEGNLDVRRQDLDAAAVARGAAGGASDRYAAKGVHLNVETGDNLALVGDGERLGQVLTNLLDNALRHTGTGGAVRLTCRRVVTLDVEWIEFAVSDDGEGIAPEHLPHVFDRFYRVDTARDRGRGGAGIGLSIAKALVEAHDGRIEVTSEGLGRGTTFRVRLPARVQHRRS